MNLFILNLKLGASFFKEENRSLKHGKKLLSFINFAIGSRIATAGKFFTKNVEIPHWMQFLEN